MTIVDQKSPRLFGRSHLWTMKQGNEHSKQQEEEKIKQMKIQEKNDNSHGKSPILFGRSRQENWKHNKQNQQAINIE